MYRTNFQPAEHIGSLELVNLFLKHSRTGDIYWQNRREESLESCLLRDLFLNLSPKHQMTILLKKYHLLGQRMVTCTEFVEINSGCNI